MIKVNRESKSRLSVPVETASDPASATISFAFPERGQRPTVFVSGTWFGDATQSVGVWRREAVTPRIGEGGLDIAAGHYRFYGKLVNGADEDVWEIDEEGLEVQ